MPFRYLSPAQLAFIGQRTACLLLYSSAALESELWDPLYHSPHLLRLIALGGDPLPFPPRKSPCKFVVNKCNA